jgi:hypothetical protein
MKPVNSDDALASRNVLSGWLMVLCGLLIIWQPLNAGLSAASLLGSLAFRRPVVAWIVVARLLAAALGVAAGMALTSRRTGAVTLAKVSLVVSAATDLWMYFTPSFPSNLGPGETPIWVGVSLAYYAGWFTYLTRSKRLSP